MTDAFAESPFPAPGTRHRAVLLGFALATVALHAAALTRYGWFRDELYYAASTEHLAWGYVDHPPLSIALLALVRSVLGDSLAAVRLVPALLGGVTVALTGHLARVVGGGRFAQALACLAAMLAPMFLGTMHFYSMNAIEYALWPLAAVCLLRALGRGRTADWALLGAVLGLGLQNKISMAWLGLGIAVGLLLTPHRRTLRAPGPWIATAIAAALLSPYVIWEVAHGFPTAEFMRNATGRKMVAVGTGEFFLKQFFDMGPGNAAVWIAGLLFALFARAGRPWRILAWIWLAVCALLLAGGRSRASYLGPAYPMLLALGGVAWERMLALRPWRRLRPVLVALATLGGVVAVPLALPMLPVESFVRYQVALGLAPRTEENLEVGPLPQHFADQFGWEELVAKVAEAYASLTPDERRRARVFGQNYGEAGAVDVLGRRLGLPRALSGHNSYWLWGPGDFDGSVLILIGGDPEENAEWFESVEIVGTVNAKYAMPYERGLNISIARRLKRPVAEVWPRLRMFI